MGHYQVVPENDNENDWPRVERVSSELEVIEQSEKRAQASKKSTKGFLFPISLALFVASAINLAIALRSRGCSDRDATARTSLWSPAFEAVEYVNYDFPNDFGQESPFRGPPTKALEKTWRDLIFQHAVSIPESKLAGLNRTVTPDLRRHEDGGYAALIEVFHQLHCLNRIRQYTWFQSGSYKPNESDEGEDADIAAIPNDLRTSTVANRIHIDHCIETLRLTLMCHSDVTPLLIHQNQKLLVDARADFSSHHRCRNFEKIREWADSHTGGS